jgi:hypothetical protein
MDNPVLTYFIENLATVSKEELLQALKNALESAECWRQACLTGAFLLNPEAEERWASKRVSMTRSKTLVSMYPTSI